MTDTFNYRGRPVSPVRPAVTPQQNAATTIQSSRYISPEEAASDERASRVLGVPVGAVRGDPTTADQVAQRQAVDALTDAPKTTQFFIDERNAAVAHDQVGSLSFLERQLGRSFGDLWQHNIDTPVNLARGIGGRAINLATGFARTAATIGQPVVSGIRDTVRAAGFDPVEVSVNGNGIRVNRLAETPSGYSVTERAALARGRQATLGYVPQTTWEEVKQRPIQSFIPFALEQGIVSAPDMAAVLLNLPAYVAARTGELGQTRAENDARTDATVGDLVAAAPAAVGSALLERLGTRGILGLDDVTRALRDVPGAVAGAVLKEGLTEAGQEGIEYTAETLGTEAGFDPAAGVDRMLAGAVGGAGFGGTVRSVTSPLQVISAQAEMREQAVISAEQFDQIAAGVLENPLLERSPERLREFLRGATNDADVYVPASTVSEFFQSNPDLDPWLDEWDIRDQVEAARLGGGDIAIPMATYLTQVLPTQADAAFRQDIRLGPDAMSLREATEAEQEGSTAAEEAVQTAVQAAETVAADTAPAARVYDDVFRQLRNTGYTTDAANAQATVFAAQARVRAERNPAAFSDAWAAYSERPLSIRLELPDSVRQSRDRADVLIEALRRGDRGLSEQQMFGPSLAQFVANNGGVTDEGGDLASFGADRWHVGKPGQRRLIRAEPGSRFTTDMVAVRAIEAGYLPEGAQASDLLAALENEVRGQPVYSAANEADSRADGFQQAVSDLDATLGQLGIDVRQATNEEIKAALDRAVMAPVATAFDQDARGSIELGENETIIRLFQSRNLSTALHEASHLWLDQLVGDAVRADAPQQIRDDAEAVLRYAETVTGNPVTLEQFSQMTVEEQTPVQELFARSGEAYLMEGKAPSVGLRAAFGRFRSWLARIYRSVRNLNVPINDEIRGVFDRILASDEEIAEARQVGAMAMPFADAASAGLPQAEFDRIMERQKAVEAEQGDRLLAKLMEPIRRRETALWRERREEFRPGVEAEVDRQPDIAAMAYLRDSGVQMNRDAVTGVTGSDAVLSLLPRGKKNVYAADGTIHPDDLAEIVGERSGEELLNRLMEFEAERRAMKEAGKGIDVRSARIEALLERDMIEAYGDPLKDGTIEAEATKALHTIQQGELLAARSNALARQTDAAGLWTTEMMREFAARTVNETEVGKLKAWMFLRAERKAGRETQRAYAKGDIKGALEASLRQQVNFWLFREATAAEEKVERALNQMQYFAGKATIKSMEQDHLEQIHGLLEQYDLRRVSGAELSRRAALGQWLAERDASGLFTPFVDERIRERLSKQSYATLPYAEFVGLSDTVKSIAFLGREMKKIQMGQEKAELDALIERAEEVGARLPDKPVKQEFGRQARFWDRTASWLRKGDAAHTKLQTVMDLLDDGDPEGVFNQVLDAGYVRAENARYDLREQFLAPVAAAERSIPNEVKSRWLDKVQVPGMTNPRTGQPFERMRRKDLIAVALNTGNIGNFTKFAKGYGIVPRRAGPDLVEDARQNMVRWLDERLDPSEWQYVQAWWQAFEDQRPAYFETFKRMTGVSPVAVELSPLTTSIGVLKGGYVPVSYDGDFDAAVAERNLRDESETFGGTFNRARTDTGNAKERTDYTGPVDLTVERIWSDANKMITHIAMGEFVASAQKFVRQPRIRALIEAKLGVEKYNEFEPWLQRIVRDDGANDQARRWLSRSLRGIRMNVSAAALLGSATVLLSQPAGLTQGAAELGGPAVAAGILKAASLEATGQFQSYVLDKSDFMRQRLDETGDRDLRDAVRMARTQDEKLARAREWAAKNIAAMDVYVVSGPIWIAAYDGALDDGRSEAVAIQIADRAVRKTQGSGRPGDLAGIQGGDELLKTMTFAYGWANALYNQQRQAVTDISSGRDVSKGVRSLMWLMLAGPLASALLTGDWPEKDDDESWAEAAAEWVLRKVFFNTFAGMIGARDIANYAERKIAGKYAGSPMQGHAGRIAGELSILVNDTWKAANGEDVSGKWPKHVINAAGYSLGLPGTAQAARSVQYLEEVRRGEQNPEDPFDWVMGLYKGPQESQE